MTRPLLQLLIPLVVALSVAAAGCQNGTESSDTSSVAAKQNPAPRPTPTPAPTTTPGPTQGTGAQTGQPSPSAPPSGAFDQDADERQMLALINQHRAENGAEPLQLDPRLIESSRWLSQDMAARSYLSHTDSLGRDSFQRMDLFGFDLIGWRGENIACGNGEADRTFQQWRYSPGHEANMINPHYTVIGIARAYESDSRFSWYWTTDFGSR